MPGPEYVQFISALTALAAVVIGPFVTIYVAKRQIKANTITGYRQKWIDNLRDELASLIGTISTDGMLNASSVCTENEKINSFEKLLQISSRIELLLNPLEPDHAELLRLVRKACQTPSSSKATAQNVDEQGQFMREMLDKSKEVLKREWERVKRFD